MRAIDIVDAQDSETAEILRDLVTLVLRHGGRLHPDLVLSESGGNVAATLRTRSEREIGARLFVIPRALAVPVDTTTWRVDSPRLEPITVGPDLTPLQRDVLLLLTAQYNATRKLDWFRTEHPRGALVREPDIVSAIRTLRPQFTIEPSDKGLLNTRQLFVDEVPGGKSPGGQAGRSCLVPILDCINHHPGAGPFRIGSEAIRVDVFQPDPTRECFVRYGRYRDAVDLALTYGFTISRLRFVFSAPLTVPIGELGVLSIGTGRPLARGRRPYPKVTRNAGGIEFGHLMIDADHPDQFRAALRMPLMTLAMEAELSAETGRRLTETAAQSVISGNVARLDHLLACAARTVSPAAVVLSTAARSQRELLLSI